MILFIIFTTEHTESTEINIDKNKNIKNNGNV